MGFIEILINNLIGYDGFILFTTAIVNVFFYMRTRASANRLHDGIFQSVNRGLIKKNMSLYLDELTPDEVDKLMKERDKTNRYYSIFTSIISIFPYLGILGTVFSLIGVAGDSSFENMQQNFLIALTSTFWGVVFAIAFKVLCDAPLSPRIELLNAEVDRRIHRYENDDSDVMEE